MNQENQSDNSRYGRNEDRYESTPGTGVVDEETTSSTSRAVLKSSQVDQS